MAREFAKGFYNSRGWAEVRGYVLKRDAYLCVLCGQPAEEVHHKIHLNSKNIHDVSISLNPDNLVSLCKSCHFAEHFKDKASGHRRKDSASYDDSQYEFDSNGQLIRKAIEN